MGGKGRGIGAFTFNVEALGIGRGSMPEARVGPNALFPVSTDHTHTHTHARDVMTLQWRRWWNSLYLFRETCALQK